MFILFKDFLRWFCRSNIKFFINFNNNKTIGLKQTHLFISDKSQNKLLSKVPLSTKEWVKGFILDKNMIVGPKTRFHLMPWERSIDIDEPIDFFLAEKVMEMVKEGRDINQYILNEGTG